jgi:hypothetical protein
MGRENGMAHEEGQIHQQISSRDKSGLCYAVTAIQTQDQSRPRSCEHQQNELHVRDIVPDGRECAAGIDRIREQRVGAMVKKSTGAVDFLTPDF